ncbi:MAG: c-type cytochrome [Deltaproteobacteria bacterium]|nr:c-type cytochrome [Deltaproteobacteria bacterium]
MRESDPKPSTMSPKERKRFRIRVVLATVATVVVVGGGASMLAHCARGGPGASNGGDAEYAEARQLYRTYCGLCHGDEGEGYAADDANALNNQDFLVSVSNEFLRVAIAEGHPGTAMAAYHESRGGPLDDSEIDALIQLMRSWQEEDMVAVDDVVVNGDALRGAEVFARECARCHGDRGQGDSAISLNHPVYLRTASDGQIRYAIAKGRRGTPMPAFEGELSEQSIDDLVALIRSWEPEDNEAEEAEGPNVAAMDGPVIVNPDGEAPDFPALREGRYISSQAVADALQSGRRMVILDARAASDYARFHLPGAIPSPYYEVETVMERIPNDGTWVIAYCACPHAASGRVMDFLREHDFQNTAVLDEGVLHWRDEGFPVVVGDEPGTLADAE